MGEPGATGDSPSASPFSVRERHCPPAVEYLNRTKWEFTKPLVPCDRLLGRSLEPPARWRREPVRTHCISEQTGKPLPKLGLGHWVKADASELFPVDGSQSEILTYTDEEYETYLQDPSWTREQTDRLFEMCARFDLRFMTIYDRFTCPGPGEPDEQQWLELEHREFQGTDIIASKEKTMEDLKDRFYSIQKHLFSIRNRSDSDPRQNSASSFNPHYETMRKEQLGRLLERSQDQVLGMAELVLEHRRLMRSIKSLKKEQKVKDRQRRRTLKSPFVSTLPSTPVNSSSHYSSYSSSASSSPALPLHPSPLPSASLSWSSTPSSSSSSCSSFLASSSNSTPAHSPTPLFCSSSSCPPAPSANHVSLSSGLPFSSAPFTPPSISSANSSSLSPRPSHYCSSASSPSVSTSTITINLPSGLISPGTPKLSRTSSSATLSSPLPSSGTMSPLASSLQHPSSLTAQHSFPTRASSFGTLSAIPDQCVARRATRPAVPGCVLRSSTLSGPPPLQARHLPKQLEPELALLGFKPPKPLPSPTGRMCDQFDQLRADIVTLINLEAYVKKAEAERDALRSVVTAAMPSPSTVRKKDKRTLETERTSDKKRRP